MRKSPNFNHILCHECRAHHGIYFSDLELLPFIYFSLCKEGHFRSAISGDCLSCSAATNGEIGNPHVGPIVILIVLVLSLILSGLSYHKTLAAFYNTRRKQILVLSNHGTMLWVTFQIIVSLSQAYEFRGSYGYPR